MTQSILKTLVAVLFLFTLSCDLTSPDNSEPFFAKVYNPTRVQSQYIDIDPAKDTLIVGEKGTILRIYANTFENEAGELISQPVKLEIKEVFDPVDMVMGNMTTTSNGTILESAGMIYVNATSNDQKVRIAEGKELGVIVQPGSMDPEMQIFEGIMDGGRIDWVDAEPTANEEIKTMERAFITIWYYASLKDDPSVNKAEEDWTEEDIERRDNWFWSDIRAVGDTIHFSDCIVEIADIETDTVRLSQSENGVFLQEVITEKGRNGFIEDYNSSYIFTMNNLGWANIDRLYEDPNAQEVNLVASVSNESEFDYVFTSMIFSGRSIYVPGYQRRDNTYGFTQTDDEKLRLPIGEEVTILATAYKGDQPYFNMQKLVVQENQEVSLQLEASTIDEMKAALEQEL